MKPRNFIVNATIERRGLRKVAVIKITDGQNDLTFVNSGGFELDTDKPLREALLRKFA